MWIAMEMMQELAGELGLCQALAMRSMSRPFFHVFASLSPYVGISPLIDFRQQEFLVPTYTTRHGETQRAVTEG